MRGPAKARGEWDPVCLAPDIRRLQPLPAVRGARPSAGWGRNHPYRGDPGSSGHFRVPCPPLSTSGGPIPVSVPASDPARGRSFEKPTSGAIFRCKVSEPVSLYRHKDEGTEMARNASGKHYRKVLFE